MEMSIAEMRVTARKAESFLKLLANEHRLMVLCQLATGERSVGDLSRHTALSQSALSQHLAKLRKDGLVRTRRDGQSIYYALKSDAAKRMIGLLYDLYCAPDRRG